MKRFMQKTALLFAAVLAVASVPVMAKAAVEPAFVQTHDVVYENSTTEGVYQYTVSGIQEGYKVKWLVKGAGKKYVTLKDTEKIANKTSLSNKITIDTNGEIKAGNKKFKIVAKVFDTKGKKVAALKDRPVIKICAETIQMSTAKITSLDNLNVGQTYDFDTIVAPVNTTSTIYWSVVDNNTGMDYSSSINADGVFVPSKVGEYTIKAEAKNSDLGQILCTSSVNVTVGTYIKAVTQTGANEIKAVFSKDVTDKLNRNNFVIKTKNATSVVIPDSFVYDTVGKTVTIKTQQNFKDGLEYEINYAGSAKVFTASVGKPVFARILTETVPAGQDVVIEYALFDINNMNVTSVSDGEVTIDAQVINGYIEQNKDKKWQLFMKDLGSTTVVNLTFNPIDGSAPIRATQTVTCVRTEVEEATRIGFTVTGSKDTPDYEAPAYKENRSISLDKKGYAHFRAIDGKGNTVKYDSITYSSSDNNALIITSNGEMTPIKTGTVNVFVTVTVDGEEMPYMFEVTVEEPQKLKSIELSKPSLLMSKTYQSGYQEVTGITAYDQFGMSMDLTNASVMITETSNRNAYASYDAVNKQIVVKNTYVAGSYTYKVAVTINGSTVYEYLYLEVKELPTTGAVTYEVQIDKPEIDVVLDKNTNYDKTATIRVARYKGGLFESYLTFNSVTIIKDGKYYSSDLTSGGNSTAVTLGGSTMLTVTAMRLIPGTEVGTCQKASTGNYIVSMRYFDSNSNAYQYITTTLKVTDSQKAPEVTISNTVADEAATNALELVKDCISVSSGEIYDCVAVGETATGSNIAVTAGKQLHIKTISVREEVAINNAVVPKVYIYHTIVIGQTLTNK